MRRTLLALSLALPFSQPLLAGATTTTSTAAWMPMSMALPA